MNRCLWLALLAGCSSSSTAQISPGAADATADAAQTDAADDAADGGPTGPTANITCGAAPYVNVGIVVRRIATTGGQGTPVEGANVEASICPGTVATTGADGVVTAKITQGVPFVPRLSAPNYLTTLITEMKLDADKAGIDALLPPSLFSVIIPGFGPQVAAAVVGVSADSKDAGTCGAIDGVTITVDNHPEAVVTYYTTDAIPKATTGTVTTASGRAAITGLPPGGPYTLTATKSGCSVDFARSPYTGRITLEAGAATLVPAYLH
jgi:hypothetical protein